MTPTWTERPARSGRGGLKTRGYAETQPARRNLVAAAGQLRRTQVR